MPRCRRRCSTGRCARSVDDTFNAITVDGECSTNDCVMLLANGASGVDDRRDRPTRVRRRRSATVCLRLALGIVRGGEGATKLDHGHRHRRASPATRRAGRRRRSPTRCWSRPPIHGGDPNWGRLIAVAGRAGVAFDLSRAAVTIGRSCCSRTACRTTRRRRRRRATCKQRRDRRRRSISAPARHRRRSGPAISAPSTCASTRSTGRERD